MCLVVIVAAGQPLPTAPLDPEHRKIGVLDLAGYHDSGQLPRWMTLPYVYDVTSRYGCACGLQSSPYEVSLMSSQAASAEEIQAAREALEDLQCVADLLEIGLAAGPVELFTYWESDRPQVEVESRRTVTLQEFRQPGFQLVERQMLTVVAWLPVFLR